MTFSLENLDIEAIIQGNSVVNEIPTGTEKNMFLVGRCLSQGYINALKKSKNLGEGISIATSSSLKKALALRDPFLKDVFSKKKHIVPFKPFQRVFRVSNLDFTTHLK
jgi:hypothetical protein